MKQFRIYLRSELGKLKNQGDACWFLRSIPSTLLSMCSIPTDHEQLVSVFSSQEKVDAFVAELPDDLLRALTKACDQDWRRNGIFNKLSRYNSWMESSVSVDAVMLQQAEPRLAYIFERHQFRLTSIVGDEELWIHEPYANWDVHAPIYFRTCLGSFESGWYRLFDGIHRAILLSRQGAQRIDICYCNAT
jgi:hypothetical protein